LFRVGVVAAAVAALIAAAPAPTSSAGARGQWCGDNTSLDRPDVVTGRQIHVVYAHPSDWTPRFSTYAAAIVDDLQALDSWWRANDPTRTPRFDLAAMPGCSGFAALDLSLVKLPFPWEHYAGDAGRFVQVRTDLVAAGFSNAYKKYLVYFDGPVAQPGQITLCGQGTISPTGGGASGYSMLYANCRERSADAGPLVVAHELLHSLGALSPSGGPHSCSGDTNHVCDDSHDILHPTFTWGDRIAGTKLDTNRDDYYGHSRSTWDVQDSQWLRRLDAQQYELTVTFAGRGGTIIADLPGFGECAATCTTVWEAGTQLQIGVRGDAGTVWRGFSGACSGLDLCKLTMDGPKSVTARLVVRLALTVEAFGPGTVTSAPGGISCPGTCTAQYDSDGTVTLTAGPSRGARFEGWSGACSGAAATCTVTLDAAKSVRATFAKVRNSVHVSVRGSGTVRSSPSALSCPATCSATFDGDQNIQLIARAAAGWKFAGWSGACSGAGSCFLDLTEQRSVTATFTKLPAKPKPKKKPKKKR
jgi:hypothetical protein